MTDAAICLERFTTLLGHHHQPNKLASLEAETKSLQRLETFLSTSTSCVSAPRLTSQLSAQSLSTNRPEKAMGAKIRVERNAVSSLPKTLLENVVRSLDHLLDARLHQLAQCLLKRFNDTLMQENEGTLHLSATQSVHAAAMLVAKEGVPPVVIIRAESIFRTLPLSRGFVKVKTASQFVALPFILTVVVVARIFGAKMVQVRMTAPGAIVGNFSNLDDRIDQADVQIDTAWLYRSMKVRCDQIVKKAYETALSVVREK